MRTTARAIIVKDDALVLMHRNKFGHEYYSLIGGAVDLGETIEQTLYREVSEEASLTITNPRLVVVEDAGSMYGIQYIYLCEYVSGELALAPHSMESKISVAGKNLFKPVWVPVKDLPDTKLLPVELKEIVIDGITKGFPDKPIMLTVRS